MLVCCSFICFYYISYKNKCNKLNHQKWKHLFPLETESERTVAWE